MNAWKLIDECAEAGIVFRPRDGKLRPMLTKGKPPEGLLERVKAGREDILACLGQLTDFEDIGTQPPVTVTKEEPISEIEAWRLQHEKTDSK